MVDPAYRLAPWTQVAQPHDDIVSGALDLGQYAANLARVFRNDPKIARVYRDPREFFAATFLTAKMRELFTEVLAALSGGAGQRVLQLRTPFGGGKSHSMVGLLHLARDRTAAVAGDPKLVNLPDPGRIQVAVLSGEELDRLTPMTTNGVTTHTLWGEMAAQLNRFDLVAEHDSAGAAPGGALLRQVIGDAPTLILLDEVLVYVEKARAVPEGESTAGKQAMLFVEALTEAVNSLPHAAMVYSLQASVGEAVGSEGLLADLDKLVSRIDAKREPVAGDEVLKVVQRRLFKDIGPDAVRDEVARAYAELARRQLRAAADSEHGRREADAHADRLQERIRASYPFHPELLDLMFHRWGSLPSYQRTRGALQFLACVVRALWSDKSPSLLIGPGEVDLADDQTRAAFFSQVGERDQYISVLSSDITSDGAGARKVNRQLGAESAAIQQLAVGSRAATAVMLYSFGARQGEDRGVLQDELVTALLTPGLERPVIVAALNDLREEAVYLHYTGRRYRFQPTPNLAKLIRDEGLKYDASEVLEKVRIELEQQLGRGTRGIAVWPAGPGAIDDNKPVFTVVYLHPDWSERREPLARFIEDAANGLSRCYRNALALAVPDASQFDQARQYMRQNLAASRLLTDSIKHNFTAEQQEELRDKASVSLRSAMAAISKSYSSVAVPVRTRSGDTPYTLTTLDLRTMVTANRSLHERVVTALDQHVFSTLAAPRLVALAGLSVDRPVVGCAELVDWFFSIFEFTKLWDKKVIATTIARAVEASEAGYSIGLVRDDADRLQLRDTSNIHFGTPILVDEIDLSDDAALIWSGYAAEILASKVQPQPSGTGDPGAPEPGAGLPGNGSGTPQPAAGCGQDQVGGGSQPPAADIIQSVDITARMRKDGLFDLQRALSWLRDARVAGVTVDIRIHVDGQIPRAEFRNAVIEPIEERGDNVSIQTS